MFPTDAPTRAECAAVSMTSCTCIHDPQGHDPLTGACLYVSATLGPCPCDLTPTPTRQALEHVFREHLRPAWQQLHGEVATAQTAARRHFAELLPYVATLLLGTDEEVARARAEARRMDSLLRLSDVAVRISNDPALTPPPAPPSDCGGDR